MEEFSPLKEEKMESLSSSTAITANSSPAINTVPPLGENTSFPLLMPMTTYWPSSIFFTSIRDFPWNMEPSWMYEVKRMNSASSNLITSEKRPDLMMPAIRFAASSSGFTIWSMPNILPPLCSASFPK